MTTKPARKSLRDFTTAEAVAEVERLDGLLAELRAKRNHLSDRAADVKRESHALKSERADVIAAGDPDLLADDSLDARLEQLNSEAKRLGESVEKVKRYTRRTELNRLTLIGMALDHFDAALADEEAALAKEREDILPRVDAYSKRWLALAKKRRALVHAHTEYRAAGRHIPGRRAGDIPEAVELRGVEPPDVKAYEGPLPHIRLKGEKP